MLELHVRQFAKTRNKISKCKGGKTVQLGTVGVRVRRHVEVPAWVEKRCQPWTRVTYPQIMFGVFYTTSILALSWEAGALLMECGLKLAG